MKEKHTRSANIQSKETSHASNQIGNIFVTVEYENGNVCLILDNRDENAESITVSYEESHKPGIKTLEHFERLSYGQQKVLLPEEFEKWKKLEFQAGVENRSIPNTSLKKLSDEAKRQIKDNPSQPKIEPSISKSEQTDNSINIMGQDLKPDIETTNVPGQRSIDYQHEVETIIQETQAKVETLAQVYENGEPIDSIEIDDPTPSQKALMILNWIARTIEDWTHELEQSGTANPDLIQTLGFANQDIKDKLKEVRGPAPPLPEPLKPDTDVSTDAEYKEFKNKCTAYVSHSEGLLVDYQLGRQTAETEYNQFIPQFIKDRLFNGVARFIKFEQLPEQLDQLLQIVGYEVVPIEIGKTEADARVHDIQASRQTNAESGTIVEIVLPGLQRKADGEIIQKPVVIRGE